MSLGQSKKDILVHILFCNEPICNANHIAGVLGYGQSTVDQSVQEMMEDHYLTAEQWKGTTKKLLLTQKGAAAAVFHTKTCRGSYSGVYRQLAEYTRRYHPGKLEAFRDLDSQLSGEEQKDFLVPKAMEYALDRDCFDELGNERVSDAQALEIKLKIAKVGHEKFGRVKLGSREYYAKYGITPTFTKKYLNDAEKAIQEARKEMSNQDDYYLA